MYVQRINLREKAQDVVAAYAAIVDAVKENPKAISSPKGSLHPARIYHDTRSQLNGQAKRFDTAIYIVAERAGLSGIKLIDYLRAAYDNFVEQRREAMHERSSENGNSQAGTADDLESRAGKFQTSGFEAGQTGERFVDLRTGERARKHTLGTAAYEKAAEQRLDEFFGL